MSTSSTLRRPRHVALRRTVGLALLILAASCASKPAAALDVTCIESSRYSYLYRLFGDDQRRFASYFNLDSSRLPPPTACRAALLSGQIEPKSEDVNKLLQMIAQNRGWLDTLYLDSGGGNVAGGVRVALVTRDFWLKTRVVQPGTTFVYDPDFGPSAGGGTADPNRVAFDKAAANVPTQRTRKQRAGCASACTYTLAAGMDRKGVAKVHRPSLKNESLEARAGAANAEALMMNLYKKMDVGDDFMALTRATARQTTSDFVISRYPRFIEDALLDRCKSDGAQLDDLSALLNFGIAVGGVGLAPVRTTELKDALARLETRRQAVGQCVAAVYEKERLTAFARQCPRGCDLQSLNERADQRLKDLKK